MKKYALVVLAAFTLLIAGSLNHAAAQIVGRIEADVPFPFYVGNTQLPAGRYEIKRVLPDNPDVLELRSKDGKTAVLIAGEAAQVTDPPSKTELIFKKFGNDFVLSQIFEAGTPIGVELPKMLQEERAAKGGASAEKRSVEGSSSKKKG